MDIAADPCTLAVLDRTMGVFCNDEVVVRVVHNWDSRNFRKRRMTLMGHELLLLDSESIAVQGFIPARLLTRFAHLAIGKVYVLRRFMLRLTKGRFRVADHKHTVVSTDQTSALQLHAGHNRIPNQRFRLRLFGHFAAIVDTDTDLFDMIGEVSLITGVAKGT